MMMYGWAGVSLGERPHPSPLPLGEGAGGFSPTTCRCIAPLSRFAGEGLGVEAIRRATQLINQ